MTTLVEPHENPNPISNPNPNLNNPNPIPTQKQIPPCVALVDNVTLAATAAISTLTDMLTKISVVQEEMEKLHINIIKANKHVDNNSSATHTHNSNFNSHAVSNNGETKKKKKREQIVGETLGDDEACKMQVVPKSDETRHIIYTALSNHFLFSGLEGEGMYDVIDTMIQEEVLSDMVIIQQGEKGDKFYVLEKGHAKIKVDNKVVGEFKAGEAFGELALMWNSPRAATIVAHNDCVMFTLSRPLFRRLLATSSTSQTVILCEFLKVCVCVCVCACVVGKRQKTRD